MIKVKEMYATDIAVKWVEAKPSAYSYTCPVSPPYIRQAKLTGIDNRVEHSWYCTASTCAAI